MQHYRHAIADTKENAVRVLFFLNQHAHHMYSPSDIAKTSACQSTETFQEVVRHKLRCLREEQFKSAWDVTDVRPLQLSPLRSIMINTYQTSLAPPPVPPRSRSQPVLIPASLPSQGHNKVLVRFLVGVVVLHLFLSLAGFFYLYYHEHMVNHFFLIHFGPIVKNWQLKQNQK